MRVTCARVWQQELLLAEVEALGAEVEASGAAVAGAVVLAALGCSPRGQCPSTSRRSRSVDGI
jgi:hypothetical protein